MTADEARERVGDIRAEMGARRLACDCVRQGVEEEDSNDY